MSNSKRQSPQIGKRPHTYITCGPGKDDLLALLTRRAKRDLITRGIIQDPLTRPPQYKFTWTYGNLEGIVYADDRSTARSLIKRDLGLRKKKRLPIEVNVVCTINVDGENNESNSARSSAADNGCDDRRSETCADI